MKFAYPYGTNETAAPVLGVRGPENSVFPLLHEMGYTAIEPFVRNPKLVDTATFTKQLHLNGLEVAAVGTGPAVADDKLTFTASDAGLRTAAVRRAMDMIEFASLFDSQVNIGKMRGDIDPHKPEQSWRWMREAFEQVCEHADKHRVLVALEPQNKTVINNLNTTREALEYIRSLNLQSLKLMLDVYHMDIEDGSIANGFVLAQGQFTYIHLADSDRNRPGKGSFDFSQVIRTLKDLEYQGYLTFEIRQSADSFEDARASIDYLNKIL